MFRKPQLDSLFEELKREWKGKADYETLLRQAHLGIALYDAGRPIPSDIDGRVVALINKHKPE